jgi:hypothetical protein
MLARCRHPDVSQDHTFTSAPKNGYFAVLGDALHQAHKDASRYSSVGFDEDHFGSGLALGQQPFAVLSRVSKVHVTAIAVREDKCGLDCCFLALDRS